MDKILNLRAHLTKMILGGTKGTVSKYIISTAFMASGTTGIGVVILLRACYS